MKKLGNFILYTASICGWIIAIGYVFGLGTPK